MLVQMLLPATPRTPLGCHLLPHPSTVGVVVSAWPAWAEEMRGSVLPVGSARSQPALCSDSLVLGSGPQLKPVTLLGMDWMEMSHFASGDCLIHGPASPCSPHGHSGGRRVARRHLGFHAEPLC